MLSGSTVAVVEIENTSDSSGPVLFAVCPYFMDGCPRNRCQFAVAHATEEYQSNSTVTTFMYVWASAGLHEPCEQRVGMEIGK